eukprot:Polyplicarium_translucidae@DN545_c0_g1_i2.p1
MLMFESLGDKGKPLVRGLGWLQPGAFIPCIVWGAICDATGPLAATTLINLCCIVMNVASCCDWIWVQWIGVVAFICVKGGNFTVLLAYLAEVFGFEFFGALYGIAAAVVGIGSQLIVPELFKVEAGGRFLASSIVMSIIGVAAAGCLGHLHWRVRNGGFKDSLSRNSVLAKSGISRSLSNAVNRGRRGSGL